MQLIMPTMIFAQILFLILGLVYDFFLYVATQLHDLTFLWLINQLIESSSHLRAILLRKFRVLKELLHRLVVRSKLFADNFQYLEDETFLSVELSGCNHKNET